VARPRLAAAAETSACRRGKSVSRTSSFRQGQFLARDVIYTPRAYARCQCPSVCPSVRLSVTEVHWRIIANLGFKFRSKFTAHCGRGEGNLNNNISRAMLATARPSCFKTRTGVGKGGC